MKMSTSIPNYCFIPGYKEVYKFTIAEKPIYVFENHAAALFAWREISEGQKIDLLTFDEHTDLHPPMGFWIYSQGYSDQARTEANKLLEKARNNDDEVSFRYLVNFTRNDEHIATAIHLGIINNAYIASHNSYSISDRLKNQYGWIYDKVHQLYEYFEGIDWPSNLYGIDGIDGIDGILQLHNCHKYNFSDSTIRNIRSGLTDLSSHYILDIDLDFFQAPFFLDMEMREFTLFCDLIKGAKAITIATELNCVKGQNETYQSIYKEIDSICQKLGCKNIFRESWTSKELLEHLINIIKFELLGTREKIGL